MDLTLNLVSGICWEIISKQTVRLTVKTLPLFKLLLEALYDFSPTFCEEGPSPRLFCRYSLENYLEITDYFSFCFFLNTVSNENECNLYLLIGDCEKFYADTEKFLRILDLKELKRVKELERNKYDLKSEADEIEEEIRSFQECLDTTSSASIKSVANDDTLIPQILSFALRNMPMGRCYTADICSGYSLIDCIRKAMKGRIINCSPHQDIYFLETHAKNEESNLENLFVSPAGREMLKYKPNTKLKQKINPNLEFLTTIQKPIRQSANNSTPRESNNNCKPDAGGVTLTGGSTIATTTINPSTSSSSDDSEKNSLDLYEEAAAILGLSCSQTDDCRCIECQCHYFDFEEEIDFPTTGNDYGKLLNVVDHTSSCSIQ